MKNTITTITLAITLAFGATFANAGIIVSDSPSPACEKDGIIIEGLGIIIEGLGKGLGIIIEKPGTPCTATDGIIIE
jgi:hypothetical protein